MITKHRQKKKKISNKGQKVLCNCLKCQNRNLVSISTRTRHRKKFSPKMINTKSSTNDAIGDKESEQQELSANEESDEQRSIDDEESDEQRSIDDEESDEQRSIDNEESDEQESINDEGSDEQGSIDGEDSEQGSIGDENMLGSIDSEILNPKSPPNYKQTFQDDGDR
jgi:hypothetical protein